MLISTKFCVVVLHVYCRVMRWNLVATSFVFWMLLRGSGRSFRWNNSGRPLQALTIYKRERRLESVLLCVTIKPFFIFFKTWKLPNFTWMLAVDNLSYCAIKSRIPSANISNANLPHGFRPTYAIIPPTYDVISITFSLGDLTALVNKFTPAVLLCYLSRFNNNTVE